MAKIRTDGTVTHAPGHEPGGAPEAVQEAVSGPETAAAEAEPVPVAEQLAAGVDPAETVTMADQRAGVPPPPPPPPPPEVPS